MSYNTLTFNLIADDDEDEQDIYSHRRNSAFCAKCGGICQYDDDGELIDTDDETDEFLEEWEEGEDDFA